MSKFISFLSRNRDAIETAAFLAGGSYGTFILFEYEKYNTYLRMKEDVLNGKKSKRTPPGPQDRV